MTEYEFADYDHYQDEYIKASNVADKAKAQAYVHTMGYIAELSEECRELRRQRDELVRALWEIHNACLKAGITGIGNIALDAIEKAGGAS